MRITMRAFISGLCLLSLFCAICKCSFVTDEESLRADLLTNYSSKVRPAMKTEIYVGIILGYLNSLTWYDTRLAWNPANYGGLESLVTAPEDIWTPPVVIENAIDNVGVLGGIERDGVPLRVTYAGQINWAPPQDVTTSCEMAIAHYPFDTQRCTVVLIGWTYPVSEMQITALPVDSTTLYSENGEFDLTETMVSESNISQSQMPNETYRKLHFEMTFRRKWQFYGQNLILPIVLNSILMNVVFVLPIESGEKMGYSLTVLLTYIVFLTWVTENLPPVSTDTSILQVYLAIVLAMGCLATVLTTLVLHLYHTDPNKPMGKVYRTIAYKVLVPFSNCIHFRCGKKTKVKDEAAYDRELPDREVKVAPMPARPPSSRSNIPAVAADHSRAVNGFEPQMTKGSLAGPKHAFEGFEPKATREDGRGKGEADPTYTWQELAKLCDCFFMWTFAGVMILLSIVVLSLLYDNY